jgi:hypothetical protein
MIPGFTNRYAVPKKTKDFDHRVKAKRVFDL